jgi:hypothetical protein
VAFVAISAILARAFSADGAERAAVTALVKAEAHGDVSAAVRQVQACGSSPSCRARVSRTVTAVKRPGGIQILQLTPSTSFSLGGTLGNARVAYRVGNSLPIVQCVRVRRAGNVISGLRIELLSVTTPLSADAACGSGGGP